MTLLKVLVQDEPTGTPFEHQQVRIVDAASGVTVPGGQGLTDAEGFVAYQGNARPFPVAFRVEGVAAGTKVWDSRDALAAGPLDLGEVPVALFDLEGVVPGEAGAMAVSVGGEGNLWVAPGAAVVAGHPVRLYDPPHAVPYTPPATSTRVDRVVLSLDRASGDVAVVLAEGTEAGPPALVRDAATWQQSLARVTIPTVGSPQVTDERTYAEQRPDLTATLRIDAAETANAVGEALAPALPLVLPWAETYDVFADLTAQQVATEAAWLAGTPTTSANGLAFSNPGQVAHDASGNLYLADPGNNRLVKLDPTGAYLAAISGLTGITGVAVDPAGNVYVAFGNPNPTYRKYNAAFVQQWTVTGFTGATFRHLATDGTYLWVVALFGSGHVVMKVNCSNGSGLANIGSGIGSGAAQFNNPWGIMHNPYTSEIYVVDSGNHRVQRVAAVSNAFVAAFGSFGLGTNQYGAPRGIAISPGPPASSQQIWVADHDNHRLVRVGHSGVSQEVVAANSPDGVAVPALATVWSASDGLDALTRFALLDGGHGALQIGIDGGAASGYLGIGDRDGEVQNALDDVRVGAGTLLVRVWARAATGSATFRTIALTVRAVPRRAT